MPKCKFEDSMYLYRIYLYHISLYRINQYKQSRLSSNIYLPSVLKQVTLNLYTEELMKVWSSLFLVEMYLLWMVVVIFCSIIDEIHLKTIPHY